MKRWWKWIVAALVVALLAGVALRALSVRRAQQQAQAEAAAAKTALVVELAATDFVEAKVRDLAIGLPVTGALKAVTSAFVKARVPGELQGLTVREGDAVKAGQVIARIESTEFQARLRQAEDQANAAKARYEFRAEREEREKAEKAERLARAAAAKAAASVEENSLPAVTDADAAKKAAIAAAMERVRQKREAAAAAAPPTQETDPS